ncbi:uncharacterized protein ACWYII_023659 [Salvelinus alpinus]
MGLQVWGHRYLGNTRTKKMRLKWRNLEYHVMLPLLGCLTERTLVDCQLSDLCQEDDTIDMSPVHQEDNSCPHGDKDRQMLERLDMLMSLQTGLRDNHTLALTGHIHSPASLLGTPPVHENGSLLQTV